VVPNPYYGYSYYQLNTEGKCVKITNLPTICVVSIYDAGGRLIRRFDKNADPSWINWDLNNSNGKCISS
jgi:hypothetical protein